MSASPDTAVSAPNGDAAVRVDSYLRGFSAEAMAAEVRAGLSRGLKELSPKYLYDARGCELFDRITTLPEYYPTRCEREILNRNAGDITAGAEELVELGSGTASKTRALLYAMSAAGTLRRYVPFDVSEDVVESSALELIKLFPGLRVHGVVGDFGHDLERLPMGARRVFAFLGGTIGNLHPPERARFLARLRALMDDRDRLLIGTDLVKDPAVIEAAYNDGAGVTAEFNRNVLRVLNESLDADFDVEAFSHRAFFDAEHSWVEMRLRAESQQRVRVAGARLEVAFEAGEELRTEISTKFSRTRIERELEAAGLRLDRFMTDEQGLFGLTLASAAV